MQNTVLISKGPFYYSQGDEDAFFAWLQSIPCVAGVGGSGTDLHIELKSQPDDLELRELLALFFRYKMDMKSLAIFETSSNAAWFSKKSMYWYKGVFGSKATSPRTHPSDRD